jgi:hypothetical protein
LFFQNRKKLSQLMTNTHLLYYSFKMSYFIKSIYDTHLHSKIKYIIINVVSTCLVAWFFYFFYFFIFLFKWAAKAELQVETGLKGHLTCTGSQVSDFGHFFLTKLLGLHFLFAYHKVAICCSLYTCTQIL